MTRAKKEEPVEVEAEVIEAEAVEDKGLSVSFTPAAIEANFASLDARVDKLIADYKDARYDLSDAENIKQAKRDRTYLNGIAKEIDERRKAVKREYMRPYDEFEAKANAITAKVKAASANIKEQLDEAEEERKDRAYAILKEFYEDLAGLLVPVVPYDRIHEERWLNKTFGEVKAKNAIEEKVTKIAGDWETLKAQKGMPHYETAERVFFETLDLGSALNAAREAQAADERIAELHEAVDSRFEDAMPDTEPETVPAEEPAPIAPEPVPIAPEPVPAAPEPVPMAPVQPASVPVAAPGGEYVPCVMVITAASREQMQQIGRFCGGLNPRVTGKFVTGTLEEAYMKECAHVVANAAMRGDANGR